MVAPILGRRRRLRGGLALPGPTSATCAPTGASGNLVLTRLLRLVARQPLTDGQSGYRALSHAAARDAEIVHDFNYAQVLTLDLLGKGYRYAEVPIGYAFREHGRSFVRLGGYLRRVGPGRPPRAQRRGRPPAQGTATGALVPPTVRTSSWALWVRPVAQPGRPAGHAEDPRGRDGRAVHQDVGLAAGECRCRGRSRRAQRPGRRRMR